MVRKIMPLLLTHHL